MNTQPNNGESVVVSGRISRDMEPRILKLIKERGFRNKSVFIEQAIIDFVNRLETETEPRAV